MTLDENLHEKIDKTPLKKHECRVVIAIGVFLIIGVGLFVSAFLWQPFYHKIISYDWVAQTATIVANQVEHRKITGGQRGKTSAQRARRRSIKQAKLFIEFEYVCQNQNYRSDQYDFYYAADWRDESDALLEIINAHPVGKVVECWVNPRNPAQAVINRDIPTHIYYGLLLLPLPIGGVLLIVYGIRRKNNLCKSA